MLPEFDKQRATSHQGEQFRNAKSGTEEDRVGGGKSLTGSSVESAAAL